MVEKCSEVCIGLGRIDLGYWNSSQISIELQAWSYDDLYLLGCRRATRADQRRAGLASADWTEFGQILLVHMSTSY